ncbi:MAG: D-alanine--D-alanine ligase [Spirochaetia bacterium]|nr:D-alanine--D-alanine ligase [Spirochaetia bacterium]
MKNILLFYGGNSGEHEISCISASFIEKNLLKAGYAVFPVYVDRNSRWHLQKKVSKISQENQNNPVNLNLGGKKKIVCQNKEYDFDFAFSIIHGTTGEDGCLQGMFEFLNVPYAGSGVLASSICMDKFYMRDIFSKNNIPQVEYLRLQKDEFEKNREKAVIDILTKLKFPIFIKPCNLGSSVGVYKSKNQDELRGDIEKAFEYDNHILCEQGYSVREIEISILGNYPEYETSIAGEIIPNHEFYSYEAKYLDENGARLKTPAELTDSQFNEIQSIAKSAFAAVSGSGFARIDFFIDKETNKIMLNEINTLPGFTPVSMFPKLFDLSGKPAEVLLKEIVELGEKKFHIQNKLKRTFN